MPTQMKYCTLKWESQAYTRLKAEITQLPQQFCHWDAPPGVELNNQSI